MPVRQSRNIDSAEERIKAAATPKTNMKDLFRGVVFTTLWYLSIIAGFFILVCPMIPLVVISPKTYRRWSDIVFGAWEPFPVAMMEVFLGIRVVLSGDKVNPFESSLFIMNHRTRVDWCFLWLGLFHCCQPNAHNIKYILKAPIMHVPGPGWVMQTCSFIFVHRNWKKDRPLLEKMLDYLNYSDELYQILLFPEGTDLSDDNLQKSHKFADEHHLNRYYYVLHPRTTGFAYLAHKMKEGGQFKAVYDVTVAYPNTVPATEADLLRGNFPEEVHFHFKRYSSRFVPHLENELKVWLNNVWREKEEKLKKFYSTGCFTNGDEDVDRVDFGSLKVKNGNIAYRHGEGTSVGDESDSFAVDSRTHLKRDDGLNGNQGLTESEEYLRTHINCPDVYRSKNYRPSHLLYLVLIFWLFLIIFVLYELFNDVYMQIWVLTHSLLFAALSFVSNGFHQIAASFYFYRHPLPRKKE